MKKSKQCFCSGAPVLQRMNSSFWVECSRCGRSGDVANGPIEAIRAWNSTPEASPCCTPDVAINFNKPRYYWVSCPQCEASGPTEASLTMAIEQWNMCLNRYKKNLIVEQLKNPIPARLLEALKYDS